MNPISVWLGFCAIFQAAKAWDKRLARRKAQFDAFMKKVFPNQGG